jgi:hypothetical protein
VSATAETPATERQILLLGPYGVLGTGVIDDVAENPKWGIITAARRFPPTYRAQAATPHISVDLLDREGTTKAFSSLDKVTDQSYGFSLGAFNAPAKETEPVSLRLSTTTSKKTLWLNGPPRTELAGPSCVLTCVGRETRNQVHWRV